MKYRTVSYLFLYEVLNSLLPIGISWYILVPFLGHNCFGFRDVKVYYNSDNALAGLIRKIRNVSLYVPGFNCVNVRSLCM